MSKSDSDTTERLRVGDHVSENDSPAMRIWTVTDISDGKAQLETSDFTIRLRITRISCDGEMCPSGWSKVTSWKPIETIPCDDRYGWVKWKTGQEEMTDFDHDSDPRWWARCGATHWREATEDEREVYWGKITRECEDAEA